MSTRISPLAGKPAPASLLVDVARLVTAYYAEMPDPAVAAQRVALATILRRALQKKRSSSMSGLA